MLNWVRFLGLLCWLNLVRVLRLLDLGSALDLLSLGSSFLSMRSLCSLLILLILLSLRSLLSLNRALKLLRRLLARPLCVGHRRLRAHASGGGGGESRKHAKRSEALTSFIEGGARRVSRSCGRVAAAAAAAGARRGWPVRPAVARGGVVVVVAWPVHGGNFARRGTCGVADAP